MNRMSRLARRLGKGSAVRWAGGVGLLALVLGAGVSLADGTGGTGNTGGTGAARFAPYQSYLEDVQFQPTSGGFKFQARISQGGLDLDGLVTFDKVFVGLAPGAGQNPFCLVELKKVQVRNSVLNLDLDSAFSTCATLKQDLASSSGAVLKICLNDASTCLAPIPLGTVPFAIKADIAGQAFMATQAQTAAQAHYAHRAAADEDLFTSGKVGQGYFEFHSAKTTATLGTLVNDTGPTKTEINDGFLQWAPVAKDISATVDRDDGAHPDLHICARTPDDAAQNPGTFYPLDSVSMHAKMTALYGAATIRDDATIGGDASVGKWVRATEGLQLAPANQSGVGLMCGHPVENGSRDADLTCRGDKLTFRNDVTFAGAVNLSGKNLTFEAENKHLAANAVGGGASPQGTTDVIKDFSIKGGSAPGGDIGKDTITDWNLAPNSVGYEELKSDSVGSNEIANGAIQTVDINDGVVTGAKLSKSAVGLEKLKYSAWHSVENIGCDHSSDSSGNIAGVKGQDVKNPPGLRKPQCNGYPLLRGRHAFVRAPVGATCFVQSFWCEEGNQNAPGCGCLAIPVSSLDDAGDSRSGYKMYGSWVWRIDDGTDLGKVIDTVGEVASLTTQQAALAWLYKDCTNAIPSNVSGDARTQAEKACAAGQSSDTQVLFVNGSASCHFTCILP